jgi:hypothetical protein
MPDHVLILANEYVVDAQRSLPPELVAQSRETRDVLLVAPMMPSRLQSLCSDIDQARSAADARLRRIASDISRFRSPPRLEIGDEDQLTAVTDALATFPAEACVVIAHPDDCRHYRERGIAERIRARFNLPTSLLTVTAQGQVIGFEPS